MNIVSKFDLLVFICAFGSGSTPVADYCECVKHNLFRVPAESFIIIRVIESRGRYRRQERCMQGFWWGGLMDETTWNN
jgi:hypothetical protein